MFLFEQLQAFELSVKTNDIAKLHLPKYAVYFWVNGSLYARDMSTMTGNGGVWLQEV